MLVDSHCHLDRLKLDDMEDGLNQALDQARIRGISRMLCVCISAENRSDVLAIANQHDDIFCSAGVHPCDVKADEVVSVDTLKEWASEQKVVALGETGLDYYYSDELADEQKTSFKHHLIAAGELALPVIVHTRDAREDTLQLIDAHGNKESSGVLHCFTESWDMAKRALEMNYYISFSGIVTFKNAEALREVAKNVPMDRILVETDSPYLAPVPYRGKSNEPKYVREVAEFVADLKKVDFDEFCETTTNNFFKLFNRAS